MRDKAQLLKRLVVIAAVTVISLMLRTDSEAVTYWEEDFENHLNNGTPFTPWDTCADPACPIDGGNPGISPDFAFSGTHSLKGHYTGLDSGNWIDRNFPNATDEIWTRFYYRTQNFTYCPSLPTCDAGTKHFNIGDGTAFRYPNFWLMHEANAAGRQFYPVAQVPEQNCGTGAYDACNYFPNMANIPILDGQWYCIETQYKMNTPGVANGVVGVWVNGTQTVGYTNALLRGPNVSNPNQNSSLTTFTFVRLYVQHGVGDMFYD